MDPILLLGIILGSASVFGTAASLIVAISEFKKSSLKDKQKSDSEYSDDRLVSEFELPEPNFDVLDKLEYPEGQVPLESPFYVKRPVIEELCYKTIVNPGALLRIKAPLKMGKTSLVIRVLDRARQEGFKTVYLDLRLGEQKIVEQLDTFLRWFCQEISRKLELEDKISEFWDEDLLSSISNCNDYFEKYLLSQIKSPIVLAVDNADSLFDEDIAQDLFGMLRTWHEYGKEKTEWKKLHLIISYSTDVYIPLNVNRSPFNVGQAIELPELNPQQIDYLVKQHGLNWTAEQIQQLTNMVGGHPYLIRLALYHLGSRKTSLEELLKTAPTIAGIYQDHLQRLLNNLQRNSELTLAFQKIVTSDRAIELKPIQEYKLQSMGLIKWTGNDDRVRPRYQLYRLYFSYALK